MLVLLGTSTLAAALVPPPQEQDPPTSSTTSPRTSPVPTDGQLLRAKLDAEPAQKRHAAQKRPEVVRVPLGDQLALEVHSKEVRQIAIRGLGLIDDAAPLSPARFDILARRPGSFPVEVVEPPRRIAVIEVPRGG